ncbi:MAG: pilus assembly protein TadB [Micromonosporaceae bacterium]|nr:pilus assembly protein TadB [Micromonosporaceae bacterium]
MVGSAAVILVAAAVGALGGLGLLLVIVGLRGIPSRPAGKAGPQRRSWRSQRWLLRAGGAFAAAVVMLAVTGWVAAAAFAAAATVALPRVLAGGGQRRAAAEKTEAIARWAEMLRDSMAGAMGLEEAINVTAAVAPRPIASEVDRLAVRLERWPLPAALRQFGMDLSDPAGDLLVAALITAATKQTRQVGRLLGELAVSTRNVARMHERVEASRAGIRSAVRMITITVLGFVAGLIVLARSYLEPYDTVAGQVWLVLVAGTFAGAFLMLGRMAVIRMPPRSFAVPQEEG